MEKTPRSLSNTLEGLPDKFRPEDDLGGTQKRKRQFTPRSLLLTLIQLVGHRGKEGYDHALLSVFGVDKAPSKGALSWFRSQISFRFFEDILTDTISNFDRHRPTFDGLILYAVDGWQMTLPRSESVVKAGYTGRKTSKHRESYMPKGFMTHAVDVLSETTKAIAINSSQTELADALSFIPDFEKNSLTMYDRAYFSRALCLAHFDAGNYFLARCQSNANRQVTEFFQELDCETSGMYYSAQGKLKKVWFIKFVNPRTKEQTVFATNLPRAWRNKKLIDQLYQLRWGSETSFYELSETMKLEQWHSKSFNGILQEIYVSLLVLNLTKILSFFARGQKHINPENSTYSKPNFKLLITHFIKFVVNRRPQLSHLIHEFQALIKRSTEKRKRRSRSHPREIRSPASPYPYYGSEWQWEKAYTLN